jgi:thiamine monophosphate kinase
MSISRMPAENKPLVPAFSAARVEAMVDGFEAMAVDMGVDFGGGDVRVP